MDATSRILVFEALKRWRHNKTTIVITHDLSQIEPGNFVYVLKHGRVVEQGFRYDLESVFEEEDGRGEFRKMMERQSETGGFLPAKDVAPTTAVDLEDAWKRQEEEEEEKVEEETELDEKYGLTAQLKHQSIAVRPLSLGNWMFDAVAVLTNSNPTVHPSLPPLPSPPPTARMSSAALHRERRLTNPSSLIDLPLTISTDLSRRPQSLQLSPTSTVFPSSPADQDDWKQDDWKATETLRRTGTRARLHREKTRVQRKDLLNINMKSRSSKTTDNQKPSTASPSFLSLMRSIYPTVPKKPLLFLGLLVCLLSGSMTPIFSFLLSRLLFQVSSGAHNPIIINRYGGLVLGIAALDGLFLGLKYYIMEFCGMSWITHLRSIAIHKILKQDKKWFDESRHSPSDIVQVVVKDGDDARNLISVVWSQFAVVAAMFGVGLIWALVRGWQLTLAGFAIAPVFAGVMALQTRLVVKCEEKNKKAREEVAKGYYDVCLFHLFFWFGCFELNLVLLGYHQYPWHPLYGIRRNLPSSI